MNRQARVRGCILWRSYGAVGIVEAARLHAQEADIADGHEEQFEVRDEDEPDPVSIHKVTILKAVRYECVNPRGDCSAYD